MRCVLIERDVGHAMAGQLCSTSGCMSRGIATSPTGFAQAHRQRSHVRTEDSLVLAPDAQGQPLMLGGSPCGVMRTRACEGGLILGM